MVSSLHERILWGRRVRLPWARNQRVTAGKADMQARRKPVVMEQRPSLETHPCASTRGHFTR